MYHSANYEAPTLQQLAQQMTHEVRRRNNLPAVESIYYNFGHEDHELTGRAVGMFIKECDALILQNAEDAYNNGEMSRYEYNEVMMGA